MPTTTSADELSTRNRGAGAKLRQLLEEAYRSAVGQAALAALPAALAALLFAPDASWALVVGVSVAIVSAAIAATGHRVDRQVRNSADASLVAALLGDQAPSLGTWSIEADFAQLVAGEIQTGRELIVECGSGATTLVVAACLKARGSGRLLTIEHDARFAVQTRRRLDSADLSEYVDLVVAPLVEQRYGSVSTPWYDETSFAEHLPDAIDLLIVDGPPSTHTWARWPALEYFARLLAPEAVVLVDDGRRRDERRTVFRWSAEHPDIELYWHDTIKGTWKLRKVRRRPVDSRPVGALRRLLQIIHPTPAGFGRWPIRR